MKNLIFLLFFCLMFVFSCREQDSLNTPQQLFNPIGTWKPLQYEYKGKIYTIDACQKQGKIVVNNDMSGVYTNYNSTGNLCNLSESYIGTWLYDSNNMLLKLTYIESGISKTKILTVSSVSNNELRIEDYTRDIDGVTGFDDAILVLYRN